MLNWIAAYEGVEKKTHSHKLLHFEQLYKDKHKRILCYTFQRSMYGEKKLSTETLLVPLTSYIKNTAIGKATGSNKDKNPACILRITANVFSFF